MTVTLIRSEEEQMGKVVVSDNEVKKMTLELSHLSFEQIVKQLIELKKRNDVLEAYDKAFSDSLQASYERGYNDATKGKPFTFCWWKDDPRIPEVFWKVEER